MDVTKPLISILLPVKNEEDFLVDCLDSILFQQYTNWELLAVNDHSTDASRQILDTYAIKDSRVRVFDNLEKGIIPALRLAYSHSKGSYITRMDADDKMTPNKLAVLLAHLQQQPSPAIAIGQVKYFSAAKLGDGYQRYEQWLNHLTQQGTNYQEIYKECVIPSPCWMVHRSDLDHCGAFQSNRYPEDYDLCFRFYQEGLQIIPCDQVLHYWRDYPTRTSRTDDHYADNRFLDIKLDYFLQLEYQSERPLVLWGAGKKGKWIAQQLLDRTIPFHWVCDNPKKIGKDIYGKILQSTTFKNQLDAPLFIIAVGNPSEQAIISKQLSGAEFFFFC